MGDALTGGDKSPAAAFTDAGANLPGRLDRIQFVYTVTYDLKQNSFDQHIVVSRNRHGAVGLDVVVFEGVLIRKVCRIWAHRVKVASIEQARLAKRWRS
jgi:hypothetical protein